MVEAKKYDPHEELKELGLDLETGIGPLSQELVDAYNGSPKADSEIGGNAPKHLLYLRTGSENPQLQLTKSTNGQWTATFQDPTLAEIILEGVHKDPKEAIILLLAHMYSEYFTYTKIDSKDAFLKRAKRVITTYFSLQENSSPIQPPANIVQLTRERTDETLQ